MKGAFLTFLCCCCVVRITTSINCSSYNIDESVLRVNIPKINSKSGISQVFKNLESGGSLNATRTVNSETGIPCYEWVCKSPEREGEACRWCLPSVYVAGFSKCGTTALCDKLEKHPAIRLYRKKEINIFSKMIYNDSIFEHKVKDVIDRDFYNYRIKKEARQDTWRTTETSIRKGDFWLDCSAGTFRDFNAALHISKFSPLTKIIMIVRDPWQNMGSRITQQIRHGRPPKGKITELTHEFKRYQFKPAERLTSKAISQLAKGTDYAYAEKLLYWRAIFPSNSSLLLLDQYNLQHHPNTTMHQIEKFLHISHHEYSASVLQSVSHNANLLPKYSLHRDDNESAARPENFTHHNTSVNEGIEIHQPYSFTDKPVLYKLSKAIFDPSLCLFERVFGWKIHISTESEL